MDKKAIFEMDHFKGWNIKVPLIQGGMGVGVSAGRLAGAVAAEGGIGIISTAQIGYDEPGFAGDEEACNLRGIRRHIKRAKEIAGGKGMVGVNVMVALKHYREHVLEAVKSGADVVICGAGIPVELPELVKGSLTKIAPIVSSVKAAALILKVWDKKYQRVPDFIVVEGPDAGGHLGFSNEQLQDIKAMHFEDELERILKEKVQYEEQYKTRIPVFAAGGIWDGNDALRMKEMGLDGVQAATRFVATKECDASEAYKQAYVDAHEEDVCIIKSPVGMPGRAICNKFIRETESQGCRIERCYHCIKSCNPAKIPYCITTALVAAVKGDVENGLIFCGTNVGKIKEIVTVHDVVQDMMYC